ncbi:hypothetical protein [Flavimaricola marinus]|uniref:Uncharacterized protein n=1 Tax=Flavimaricola marinus TaxID=1819565 RepID=A0A238LEQ8_9RHOB|nr:hypothetical protein [Flavimaricola marinus]SMY07400.1 hypothetical protein LOM8899_01535 [Flavimaricola marinus]
MFAKTMPLAAVLAICATSAVATSQRECLFERQFFDGVARTVALPISIAWNGSRGVVLVRAVDGGQYDGTTRTGANGAMEMDFRTDVSSETIAIGSGGEALWGITFDNGQLMQYAGACGPARAQ